MGIRHQPLRERQLRSTTRWSKDCNATQQNQRSTATTSPTASWTDHELQGDQSSHPGLLQDDLCFLKSDFSCRHKLQWSTCTNIWRKGRNYKGNKKQRPPHGKQRQRQIQQQRTLQGTRQRQQRQLQQRRIQQEQRKRLLRIQRLWIKQRLQRPRKLQQSKRKRKRDMPPMWQARPLGAGLQSACLAPRTSRSGQQ